MDRLRAGRSVVVVGSSSLIGLAIVARFLARGDRVIGVSLSPSAELCDHLTADCSDPAQVARVFQEILERFDDSIDVLVTAAALNPRARAVEQTDEMWRSALGATLDSAFYSARAALPHMRPGAAVVAVSSVMARHVSPGVAGYAAAKGGLEALVRVLALEHGADGIRVNAVAPGLIGGTGLENATEGYALARTGTPDEVAAVVDFLASPDASFVTGAVVPVDGGLSVAQTGAWARPDLRAHRRGVTKPVGHKPGRKAVRRAIVTGGMSGLGAACAERLEKQGMDVVRLDVAPGADALVDITDENALRATLHRVGPVDVLVNSAGVVGPNAPLWEVSTADWERTFAVNVTGAFRMCHELVPKMVQRGWGRIVNIASIAGKDGNPRLSAYSASKAALIGMTKSLGKELATTGVLVNAVAPAVFETPMNASTAPEVLERLVSLIPMNRLGRAEELAALVAWLTSDECTFSTGAVYDISGGRATY